VWGSSRRPRRVVLEIAFCGKPAAQRANAHGYQRAENDLADLERFLGGTPVDSAKAAQSRNLADSRRLEIFRPVGDALQGFSPGRAITTAFALGQIQFGIFLIEPVAQPLRPDVWLPLRDQDVLQVFGALAT
jgi:hypothetical protein